MHVHRAGLYRSQEHQLTHVGVRRTGGAEEHRFGDVLGTRELAHPHVDEQPFTRSLTGVVIPEGVTTVEIAARDSVVGFCGTTVSVAVPAP